MKLKLLIISSFLTFSIFGAGLEFDYETREVFSLKNKAHSYSEIKYSRMQRSKAFIKIIHGSTLNSQNYHVSINKDDRRELSEMLSVIVVGNKVTFSLGNSRVSDKLTSKGQVRLNHYKINKLFSASLKKDVLHLVSGIDKNISKANLKTVIGELDFLCDNLKSAMANCYLTGKISSVVDKDQSITSILSSHFLELKQEMLQSIELNYDIVGYREFLNKSEELLRSAIKRVKTNDKARPLVLLKQMVIDERIDSYEYTAIRAKSVVDFVDMFTSSL